MQVSVDSISITFIDHVGSRVTVPGRIGQSIYDCATMHGIDLGPSCVGTVVEKIHNERWTEDLFGEGPTTGFDHIKIPREFQGIVGDMDEAERFMMEQYWEGEDITEGASRLASMVHLTSEMHNMTVFIPDGLPDDCP